MDSFAEDQETSEWIFELTQRTGTISVLGATRIKELIKDKKLSPWSFNQYMYGSVLNDLPEESFLDWIDYLLGHQDAEAIWVALGLYVMYYDESCLLYTSDAADD